MGMSTKGSGERWLAGTLGWLLIGIHLFIFSQFFPNAQGKLGHDYSYNLPLLLDGYYWFLNNGLAAVPWFTPAFCAGMPLVANPATFYFSATQFISFVVDPLSGVFLTLVSFSALGFWGFVWLLRRGFDVERWPALLGGALFLFNGFFAFRMVVGHLEFHAFMLVPLLAGLLLAPTAAGGVRDRLWAEAGRVTGSGMIIAYLFLCGMTQLIVPSVLAVAIIVLIRSLMDGGRPLVVAALARFVLAGGLGLALAAAKLAAAFAFLGHFQRDAYLLPGIEGVGRLLSFLFRVLALGGGAVDSEAELANIQWPLSRHEFEFGVSCTPFLLIAGAGFSAWRLRGEILSRLRRPVVLVPLALLVLLLAVPIPLNLYTPGWNAFLKTVPFLRNLSNFFRWFVIYIPFLALLAALAVQKTPVFQSHRRGVAVAGILLAVVQNILTDISYYHAEEYDPAAILAAHAAAVEKGTAPVIAGITAPLDPFGRPYGAFARNDAIASGNSQLLCYEPMFGFNLELYPFKNIMLGPALADIGGWLNLKNPACFLYPRENGCEPGDHFRSTQRAEAERFVAYRPFAHEVSRVQAVANGVNLAAVLAVAGFWLAVGARSLRSRRTAVLPSRPLGPPAAADPLPGPQPGRVREKNKSGRGGRR